MTVRVTSDDGSAWEYDEKAVLGSGAFGVVYRGSDAHGGRVAVKRISVPHGNADLHQMLLREGDIGRVLRSTDASTEHLVKPLAIADLDGDVCIIMPVATRSLADALKGERPDIHQGIAILRQIAEGLQELQNIGILHRDLKPLNVLEIDGQWKLSDFGLSRDLSVATSPLTMQGSGTHNYMAPESWSTGTSTFKADLYALGVIFYDVLAGYQPFPGPDREKFIEQHATATPKRLPDDLPSSLVRMAARLLAKDPAERPQDARAVLQALDRAKVLLTPAQEALSAAAAVSATRQAETEAARAALLAYEERLQSLRRQAEADLVQILQDAEEHAQESIADVGLSSDGAQWHLRLGSARVTFHLWPWRSELARSPHFEETILFAGAVYLGDDSEDSRSYPYANIAFRADASLQRGSWLLQRFNITGLVEPRGFEQSDYPPISEQRETARVVMHNYTTTDLPLEEDGVVGLLAEAVNRSR
ncbi:serine/threonine-protein kinase [Rhodococcus opacus]|uniref:serine/threonine-protein kinase n=1 Tax=Rhodococcus opacus TaxID=37919 RepID=UPI002236AD31|nr:serine/threonine-protein kinase [Rhodococcus opacus]UZG56237.1 serine/threonine protein kinase [Rhodococcus opacus]